LFIKSDHKFNEIYKLIHNILYMQPGRDFNHNYPNSTVRL